MTTTHCFETDDLALAAKIHGLIRDYENPGAAAAPMETAKVAAPPPPGSNGASAPPPAAAVPLTPATLPPPPAASAAPPAPPPPATAAAAPPPPPAAAAAAPPPPANDGLQIAPAGWTLDHIKDAAGKFTANPAKGGAAALAEALRQFCPPGESRPSIKKIYPAYWPQAHATLSAP